MPPRHRFLEPIHNVKEELRSSQIATVKRSRNSFLHPWKTGRGGAYRDRTDDLMLAKQPLSQLS